MARNKCVATIEAYVYIIQLFRIVLLTDLSI